MNLNIPDGLITEIATKIANQLRDLTPSQPMTVSPWLDADAAADYIACKKPRIYDLVHTNRIPVHREGNRLIFNRDELDAWLSSGAAEIPPLKLTSVGGATSVPPPSQSPKVRALPTREITNNPEVASDAA